MSLTFGSAPFGPHPAGWFNLDREVWPDVLLYWEDFPKRVRVELGDVVVADSRHVKALHETGCLMVLYFPRADVDMSRLEPSDHRTESPSKGTASYWTVRVGDRVAENAAWSYEQPVPSAAPISGHVAFEYSRMDACYQEDERMYSHPRDPYHRVDIHRSSRRVVVRHEGDVVAESGRPAILFETGLPPRHYLPPEDVRTELLEKSRRVSQCPYKGDGQHWHLRIGERTVRNAAWTLPSPLGEATTIADWVCFYPDRVEVEVDEERLAQ